MKISTTMKTLLSYYLILTVYTLLWASQMVASHMTHSLIILTDSYINLYKILDISLGIIHLKTQTQQKEARKTREQSNVDQKLHSNEYNLAKQIFNRICTYQFKRLPVLGSFVNRLFLAALLMSAAIEGIQTCFHASHSSSADLHLSLFERYQYSYPSILIAFALVGIVMQWCTNVAHRMRDEELESESLLNISDIPKPVHVLDAGLLNTEVVALSIANQQEQQVSKTSSIDLTTDVKVKKSHEKASKNRYSLESKPHQSFDSIPLESDDKNKIFLTSLKTRLSLDDQHIVATHLQVQNEQIIIKPKRTKTGEWWMMIRYFVSPVALISCSLVVCFVNDELIKEIADGILAVLVVALLFTASYPPMKEASKVLLQSAPDDIDLDALRSSILSSSPLIISIKELAVWSLSSKSNRVATCHIVVDSKQVASESQLACLMRDVRIQFLKQNIKCSTIQPIFHNENS